MRNTRRHASRKIGLALAGGGPEGAVYEIGALRALEEALGGIDFNDLDSYVGVSAGSFVAALLANDIPVSQLVRMIVTHEPDEQPFHFEKFFAPAYREIARRGLMLPGLVAESLWRFAQKPGDQTFREAFTRLGRAIPVGLFDNDPIRAYLERTFTRKHRTNDFRKLRNKLIVVAADLDSRPAGALRRQGLGPRADLARGAGEHGAARASIRRCAWRAPIAWTACCCAQCTPRWRSSRGWSCCSA